MLNILLKGMVLLESLAWGNMSYKQYIDSIVPVQPEKYADVSSNEKLMLYAAKKLLENKIPLTFNYLCIASFKFFPERFCCDEEFKEFPSVDRLNRTFMHLKYTNDGNPYLAGTHKAGFSLTSLGLVKADNAVQEIEHGIHKLTTSERVVDAHKKTYIGNYKRFINSDEYKNMLNSDTIKIDLIWDYFYVVPYTQINTIIEELKLVSDCANDLKDEKCCNLVKKIICELKEILRKAK